MEDVPDGAGCTEIWEIMSERRSGDPAPEKDLDDSFLNIDVCDPSCPYDLARTDPILREIGDTPVVPHPENEQIAMKIERENPTLSHKDRLGAGMIIGMREKGELEDGQRVVEASSGNTAGGVALAANRLGHPCTIVMRETTSPVKKGFVHSLGAEVIEAPDAGHDEDFYYQKVAQRYAEEHDAVFLNQYENELNRMVHLEWTGPELYQQIHDTDVTHIVGAVSTCGIMTGIGEYINSQDKHIQIVGVDGEESNISRVFHGEEMEKYDVDIEGLGQWRVTDVGNMEVLDDVRSVSDSIAISRAEHEMSDNGVLMGLSSGAAMEVAQQITQESPDANVVTIIHDGPEQYFNKLH
ncbi:PLP-dependent cysteine synthase family protein [Haloparvum sedimenti]|uniref:PLP-dependent cysteine synthase family protein n=1 Tax=Haloparvum sedimenti TaxID=1678448 RepID=UPI000AEECD5E|nr:cysteine synthase family protein [Haloparvum sedimenti]